MTNPSRRRALMIFLGSAACASLLSLRPALAEKIYTGLISSTAVGGYDPVAYFTNGKPVEGKSEFFSERDGANWYFASAANKATFDADPVKYAPAYGGHCAWAAAEGKLAKGDPNIWKIVDGRLYLNYSTDVQATWEKDIPGFIVKADANWPTLGAE
jgi:YHS domain-containing protein